MSPWPVTHVTGYELAFLKHVNFLKWKKKKTSAINFKPGLYKQRKSLRPIIGFDRTRGWGCSTKFYTERMWDVPTSVIFCIVHVFWCYPAFAVYISPILSLSCFISPRAPITTGIVVAFIPHCHSFTDFDLKVFIFWQFFSGNGYIKKQAGFILFVLGCNVWSVGLYLTMSLSHTIVMLFFSVAVCIYIPGGYFGNFWVGTCCLDPGTLNLYQS